MSYYGTDFSGGTMTVLRRRRSSYLALMLAGVLASCTIGISTPADQSTLSSQVPVAVVVNLPGWYVPGSFRASLAEADITTQFSINAQNTTATANLTLGPGTFPLTVEAGWKLNIIFVQQPPWPMSGSSKAVATFTVVTPALALAPTGLKLNVGASTPATTVSVNMPLAAPLSVTFSATPTATLATPAGVSITPPATSATFTLQAGTVPGAATLNASAAGFAPANLPVSVLPVITGFCPPGGPPGTSVTINGTGFVAPVTVNFGAQSVPFTFTSSTQLEGTVPTLGASTVQVTVKSSQQTSTPLPFTITAGPVLFRATNDRIELIRFAAGSFQLIGSVPATLSPGTLSVGLARTCDQVARASASDAQLFGIGGTVATPALTLLRGTPLPTTLTGNGTAIGFLPNLLVRGTDMGIETINPAATPMARLGGFNGGGSPSGVSTLTLPGAPPLVFRSHATGIEVYDVSNPAAPNRLTNLVQNMSSSATGSALAWVTPGARLVRASSAALEVVDVSGPTLTRRGANISGGGSAVGVGVAVTGTRAVRGTSTGIEVYDVSTPTSPQRCAFRNAAGSGTGVAVAIVGSIAFRATNNAIEAYDISGVLTSCPSPASGTVIPVPVALTAGLASSATGVALVGP